MKDERNVHDEARSGRPSLVNDDLVRKVNERVRDDRRFPNLWSVPALSSDFKDIVSSHLGYRKVAGGRILWGGYTQTCVLLR